MANLQGFFQVTISPLIELLSFHQRSSAGVQWEQIRPVLFVVDVLSPLHTQAGRRHILVLVDSLPSSLGVERYRNIRGLCGELRLVEETSVQTEQ